MKTRCWLGLMVVCAVSASAAEVSPVVPISFNYQGVLRSGAGQLLGPVVKNVTFRLYREPTLGTVVWGRTCAVLLDTNGLFNVELSDSNGSKLTTPPAAVDATLTTVLSTPPSSLYLGVTVEGANEIAPRQQLLSVPFAMMAGNVKQTSGDLTVNGNLIVTDGLHVRQGLTLVSPDGYANPVRMDAGAPGQIVVPGLRVTGNANVDGNAVLSQNLMVSGNTVLSNTVLNGTTVLNGGAQVLSKNLSNKADWINCDAGAKTLFQNADSDGFVIVNLCYVFGTAGAGDWNSATFAFVFTGVPASARTVQNVFTINNSDSQAFLKTDIVTLPYLKGETVVMQVTSDRHSADNHMQYKYFCIPFGVNK